MTTCFVRRILAFFDYPAEHWIHLRTTNPIESTFATVRRRTKVTKGPGSRAVLAAYLSTHRTIINGSALCAALAVTERD